MPSQNQGNSGTILRSLAYDNPSYLTRQSYTVTIAVGSTATSGKFYAFSQLTVWGFTVIPTAIGTSTYTVNGSATTSAQALTAYFVTNTNTTGTAVTLTTATVGSNTGPYVVGGLAAAPTTNVNVPGIGGLGGYWKYSLNTIGGTNTSQVVGTNTYVSAYAGGNASGQGGIYMNPGDVLYFISGTDATATESVIIEYSLAAPAGQVMV